jgi:hypothetical protein
MSSQYEARMDDNFFEVEEVTPLLPAQQQPDDQPLIDLELSGARPPARRKRVLQISLLLVAIIVALVTFHNVIPSFNPTHDGSVSVFQATSAPSTALLTSNINFGTVSINGLRQRGSLPLLFTIRDTRSYVLTINAPPFQPKTCTITYADGALQSKNNADCLIGSGSFSPTSLMSSGSFSTTDLNGTSGIPLSIVEIDFAAADLPADQQSQINTLLAQSIIAQQTATVPLGSYIATHLNASSTISSQRSTTSLAATAFLTASANSSFTSFPCSGLICQASGLGFQQISTLTGYAWIVDVPVALHWRFTTSSGRVLGDVSFPGNLASTVLTYIPKAGWSLSSQSASGSFSHANDFSNLDCNTGAQILQQQLPNASVSYIMLNGQGINGCQLMLQTSTATNQESFIWRFGVLLAADNAAHHLLPSLPIAPQAEINAVQSSAQP